MGNNTCNNWITFPLKFSSIQSAVAITTDYSNTLDFAKEMVVIHNLSTQQFYPKCNTNMSVCWIAVGH